MGQGALSKPVVQWWLSLNSSTSGLHVREFGCGACCGVTSRLVFLWVYWVLAGACQRHGVGVFYCAIHHHHPHRPVGMKTRTTPPCTPAHRGRAPAAGNLLAGRCSRPDTGGGERRSRPRSIGGQRSACRHGKLGSKYPNIRTGARRRACRQAACRSPRGVCGRGNRAVSERPPSLRMNRRTIAASPQYAGMCMPFISTPPLTEAASR